MKKAFILICLLFLSITPTVFASSKEYNSIVLKNKLFEIRLPQKFKNSFASDIKKNKIFIYDKQLKKSGFGGFAFGITAYKNPKDYAGSPSGRKLGELTDNKGNLFDVVIEYPTESQHDYSKGENPPESYKQLYEYGKNIEIQGTTASKYYKGRGTKGKDLYKEILNKHIKAIVDNWDSIKLEKENMSYMYNLVSQNLYSSKVLSKIGYKYYDINADGIEELLIGEIADGNWKGIIYDIYTMVNRKPTHVLSGGERNRFYICNNTFLCNEYSSSAFESGTRIYSLTENSTEIYPQVAFKYDAYANKNKPYFITYGISLNKDEWKNVDKKLYETRMKTFEKYNRFDYIPLKNLVP